MIARTSWRTVRDWSHEHWLPSALAVATLLAAAGGDAARGLLRYSRAEVLDGQWWRLLTGNLVHLGPRHLLLNLAGLIAVWAVGAPVLRGRDGAWACACAAFGVGLGLLWFAPMVAWYVGLSGLLHGLLAFAACRLLGARPTEGAALLALLVAKLFWEARFGAVPLTAAAAGGPVIVQAHLYGAVGGLVGLLPAQVARARRV